MTQYRFIEPLDVLFLRGNRLFGEPGSYGEALMPPWPSLAAGAIRSQMLAEEGVDFAAFARGEVPHPQLGTPQQPGSFRLTAFLLARRSDAGIETLHPLPADLVVTREEGALYPRRLHPVQPVAGLASSAPLPQLPALAADNRAKPESGLWLTEAGWQRYLDGRLPEQDQIVGSDTLWRIDPRVGVGLDTDTRRAADGALFTLQAVAMVKRGQPLDVGAEEGVRPGADYDAGFLAAVDGAEPPTGGTLRLGGDGRAAAVSAVAHEPATPDYAAIARTGRCRLVLTSPGIFPEGWRPPGVDADNRFELGGVRGRLVCAAVSRAEVISGWDLARNRPKAAQHVAPAGSVYWLDELEATAEALERLVAQGLWSGADDEDAGRQAEGFNRVAVAAY